MISLYEFKKKIMTEIDKEKQRIINKFGMKPNILKELPAISKEEFNRCLQEYKEYLINVWLYG